MSEVTAKNTKDANVDFEAIRERLARAEGPEYWRSLEELAQTPEFETALQREFPSQTAAWMDPVTRRRFLQVMGASLALAGVTACTSRKPKEKIFPYAAKQPEDIIPGKPLFFATAMPAPGGAMPLLVESHEGRPTKIEGNPEHPMSMGATDLFAQAEILTMYDPDRSQTIMHRGDIQPWSAFAEALRGMLNAQAGVQGEGIRILTETVTSPTLGDQLARFLKAYPKAKWHADDGLGNENAFVGAKLARGQVSMAQYRFDQAEVVLSLDADFLSCSGSGLKWTRDFTRRRRPDENGGEMNRLYVIESAPTNIGGIADHRLAVRASEVESFARAIASALGVGGVGASETTATQHAAGWIAALVADLKAHSGRSVVVAGEYQPPVVHALAGAINDALGNSGKTVSYGAVPQLNAVGTYDLASLCTDLAANKVRLLIVLGGNPAYTTPADLKFEQLLRQLSLKADTLTAHLGLYNEETASLCHWHIPAAHFLEAWGDARTADGTEVIIQPLIAPLYGGKSASELMTVMLGEGDRSGHDVVQAYWKSQHTGADFDTFWRKSVHDGFIQNSALPTYGSVPAVNTSAFANAKPSTPKALEIIFRPDPTIADGRYANNAWLQELPKPLTKITWENVIQISPRTAEKLKLHNEDVAELSYRGAKVEAPVYIVFGHPDDAVTVHLGYGRTRAGTIGNNLGFNANLLRHSDAPWHDFGAELRPTGRKHALAQTQGHFTMENRNLVRATVLEEFKRNPHYVHDEEPEPDAKNSLTPLWEYKGHKWGMAIDLNACVGCSACVIACQAENNIPVVGADQVRRGREMHWLRIDQYYSGSIDNPKVHNMPVPCMHCENAPCELVCPVEATSHSHEGLNDMTYNRCVGTRFCQNNCPYKVRRFNFLEWTDYKTPQKRLMYNPDVTVRQRGVMEKCTYCVQRINSARIDSEREDRPLKDGEILTACQAVCPAEAIVFGDINDPESKVAKLKARERNYGLLADLNTRPRTTYLGAVRNPNPEILKIEESMKTPKVEDVINEYHTYTQG